MNATTKAGETATITRLATGRFEVLIRGGAVRMDVSLLSEARLELDVRGYTRTSPPLNPASPTGAREVWTRSPDKAELPTVTRSQHAAVIAQRDAAQAEAADLRAQLGRARAANEALAHDLQTAQEAKRQELAHEFQRGQFAAQRKAAEQARPQRQANPPGVISYTAEDPADPRISTRRVGGGR